MKFSERYGYLKPSEVIIREQITPEIQNAICNCFQLFSDRIGYNYTQIERYIWCYFMNQRVDFFDSTSDVIRNYIQNSKIEWFKKLDLIETILSLSFLERQIDVVNSFSQHLNFEFERLNSVIE